MILRTLVLFVLGGCSVGNLDLDGKEREQAEEDQWPDNVAYLTEGRLLDVNNYADRGVSLFARGIRADQWSFYDTGSDTNQLLVPSSLDQPFYRHARRTIQVTTESGRRRDFRCEAATVGDLLNRSKCQHGSDGEIRDCGTVNARVVGRGGVAPCPMADNAYTLEFDAKPDRLWMRFAEDPTLQELIRLSVAYDGGWKPMNLNQSPGALVDPSAFVFGKKALFFGRAISGGFDGGFYDPEADEWTPIAKDGLPSGGGTFQTLWIDQKLYLFTTSGGAILDADANAWRAIKAEGAPTFGESFVVAYDGGAKRIYSYGVSEGGAGTSFSVGAIYDVETDRWSDYPVATGPQVDTFAGAAWTGRELLIWSDEKAGRAAFYPQTGQWVAFEKVDRSVAEAAVGQTNRVLNTGNRVLLLPSGYEYTPALGWVQKSYSFSEATSVQYDEIQTLVTGVSSAPGLAYDYRGEMPLMYPKSLSAPEHRPGAAVVRVGEHLVSYGGCEKKVNDRCQVFTRGGAVVKVLPYK